jgi:hypothetical protein
MTDFDRTATTTYNEPLPREPLSSDTLPRDTLPREPFPREPLPRIAVAPRAEMTNTGPLFSSFDMAAGVVAAVMLLGPLAMAAFAVGR